MDGGSRSIRFPWRLFCAVFAALFGLMAAWSLATPIYAVPDEASHTVRATAAVHGQIVGDGKHFLAPGYLHIPGAGSCFAGRPDVTPACVGSSPYGAELRSTISTAGTNSPVYYLVVGMPSLVLTGEPAVFGMRLLSAALTAAFFAAAAVLLLRAAGSRWAFLLALAVITPEVVFLGGAINPNALEMASAGALFAALLVLARERPSGWAFGFAAGTAIAATVFVTGGRSLALLWVLLAAGGIIALLRVDDWRALARRRSTWTLLAALAAVCLCALWWFTRPENSVRAQLKPTPGSLMDVAQTMLENTFVYWRQLTGQFGTMDVPAPEGVQTLWTAIFLAVIVLPLVLGRGRARWVAAGLTAVLLLLPVATQVALWRQVGDVWQGRYVLAVLLLVALAGGLALDAAALAGSRRTVAVLRALIVLLAVGQLAAFAFTLRRYAVADTSWTAALLRPVWQPPGTVLGLTVLAVVVLTLSAIAVWRLLPTLFADQGAAQGGAAVGSALASGSHRNS